MRTPRGTQSQAPGNYAHAQGQQAKASAVCQDAQSGGAFVLVGDAQASTFVARRETTDATPVVLYFDGGTTATLTGGGTNVLTIPVNRAYYIDIKVVARRNDSPEEMACFTFRGLVVRNTANDAWFPAALTSDTPVKVTATTWNATVTLDTSNATNNYLKITVTGAAGQTIRWVARLDTVEVG